MDIIIPMAGGGARFVNAGYKEPKPLIKVGGKCIVEYVCDMYDRENDGFIFICNEEHVRSTDMASILEKMVRHPVIISIPQHKLGPVFTVLEAQEYINDNEPVIVSYCDNPVIWDYYNFKQYVVNNNVDGCLVSHMGFHPHTLSSTMFAYSKTDKYGLVSDVKEKSCYTDNRFLEHASSGVYYFKYGSYIKKYFRQLIDQGINHNGEFYVTLVFNLLIRDGLHVRSYLNGQVLAFGTPSEIRNFEAWQTILNGGQVTNEKELLECYSYWKRYRNQK
jgi:NDP-sugar pyrophosphorylase family protein